jgi:site-specific DNA-methyltransferase (adenine-specific)
MIAEPLRPLARPITDFRLLDGNPRRGDVAACKRSLKRFGQRKPIVVREDGTVEAGNTTLKAALELGWTEIAVAAFTDDDVTAKAFALADNRTSELGSFDLAALAAMAVEVQAADPALLEAASYSEADLNALLAGQRVPEKRTDPDAVPDAPADPVTQPGDMWQLGPHRLLCGDSTVATDIDRLMAGDLADLVFTDPPYGVGYTGGAKPREALQGDQLGTTIYGDALPMLQIAAADHAALYLWYADAHAAAAAAAAAAAGYVISAQVIWVKNNAQFVTSAHYKGKHEPCYYAHRKGCSARWYGPNNEVTVWEANRANKNEWHPTQKPVELGERAIRNSSPAGGLVLDLFGGSGSTMIAAHATGRRANLMEIEPPYCDVICRRYQEHAGTKPVLESTGQPHDFTA